MAEWPCSNISIMQLFHELKQQFPAVPDRVVTECIKQNLHDKEACEVVLSRENQNYSFFGSRVGKMAASSGYEPCRPDTLQLEDTLWDFNRQLVGRKSLDSVRCSRDSAQRMYKRYSEEFLKNPKEQYCDDRFGGRFSQLSVEDMCWRREDAIGGESFLAGQNERTRANVHSAPVTPSNYPTPAFSPLTVDVSTQRHCTKVNVEPTPHYHEPSRPYTSVNLTLRPPSADPQPPIDISSGGGGLTYSSCCYDPRQGYQSRVQISIGPGGRGSVTAARTLSPQTSQLRPTTSMPDITSASIIPPHLPPQTRELLREQLERKDRLALELHKCKEQLRIMKQEISIMTADWEARMKAPIPSVRVKTLVEEIALLTKECARMAQEVDYNAKQRNINTATLPLGETNAEFYKHIYRGQPFPHQRPVAPNASEEGSDAATLVSEGRNWTCHVCTFHNHPALNKCEQCDMPRIVTGSLPTPLPLAPSLKQTAE